MGGDPLVCDVQNPLLPKRGAVQDLILIALIVGTVVCSACVVEAVLGEAELAATGAMISGSGLGALRQFIGRGGVGAAAVPLRIEVGGRGAGGLRDVS